MHVCIVGAGVIGVTTAWLLAQRGWQVTLIDANSGPAQTASYANGGQLSYNYVAPLAGPGVLANLPNWLLRQDSPLRFRPRLDPHQWRWCLAFMRACNASTSKTTTADLLQLSFLSRSVLNGILESTHIDFNHLRNGKLILYRNSTLLDKARRQVEYQAQLGSEQYVLSDEQTVRLEPALAPIQKDLAGAIHTPGEESGDCHAFASGLFDHLSGMDNVRILMNTRVKNIRRKGNGKAAQVTELLTNQGQRFEADHYVIAAGITSRELLRPLNINLPLYPLKGYSLSVPCSKAHPAPAISVTDYERRTVYAPINGSLRVAAMVGIGAKGEDVEDDRISLMKRQIGELFPSLDLSDATAWAGCRPATPHGRPIIGPSGAADNLWLNVGHGALGFTLACGSAKVLETMLAAETSPVNTAPYRVQM